MNIINTNLNWNGKLENRTVTKKIILHHIEAKTASIHDIHSWHLANGWAGVGYSYYIRKDGSIFNGRPEGVIGAHAQGHNGDSIGIAFEGNFEIENPTEAQILAGIELINDIRSRYGNLDIKKHSMVNATACPGKLFPFDRIINEVMAVKVDKPMTRIEALEVLTKQGVMNSPEYWNKAADVVNNLEGLLINMAKKLK